MLHGKSREIALKVWSGLYFGARSAKTESGKACHWHEGTGPKQKLIGWVLTAREGRSGWVFSASGICGSLSVRLILRVCVSPRSIFD